TKLSLRIAFYCAVYQIAVWSLVIIERHLSMSMERIFGKAESGLIVFLVTPVVFLGILFIRDAIIFSHRFVGPLYRFRKTVQAITAGEKLDFVTLREADFLHEMKDELNAMLKVLEERGAVALKETAARQNEYQAVGK